ncbi:MAG: hypothetical protein V1891_00855 [bacterium]
MNLSKNIPKKYLVLIMIAPLFLFIVGLSIEKLIKFNGACYHIYGISSHYYECKIMEYIKNDVFEYFLFYAIMGLPLYLMFFIIPISIFLLIAYLYKKLRTKS